jgi:hypothetical protein
MKILRLLLCALQTSEACAQLPQVQPQILNKAELPGKVTVVEVAEHFVTTIRVPEAVNSVVVGDPTAFQVEHSEREPKLVFVKAITSKAAETNLLISTVSGHEVSLLLVARGDRDNSSPPVVDFLVQYEQMAGFLVQSAAFPSALVGQTVSWTKAVEPVAKPKSGERPSAASSDIADGGASDRSGANLDAKELERLLEEQKQRPLPELYGEHPGNQAEAGNRIEAGVSRVIDGGQEVTVMFSVLNPTKHAILLMPPQIQLSGRKSSGKLIHHTKTASSDQMPVLDFRLSRRRLGPGERADGVVFFERPPYKQANETLLLQMAESGAIDRPALAPIGFGVSSSVEDHDGKRK